MNFDDYVNHIRKKYRLALAVTIIQNKPEHICTEEYIKYLRKNVESEKNSEIDEISIHSNDFLYDENDNRTDKIEQYKEISNNSLSLDHKNDNGTIFYQENYCQQDRLDFNATIELNTVEINENSNKINNNYVENHETPLFKDVPPIDESSIISTDFPNVALMEESEVSDTHVYMESPNILENFDIEHAIQANKIDKTIIHNGAEKEACFMECDDLSLKMQEPSHVKDKTRPKASNNYSVTTKANNPPAKPKIIIEETQLIDSDTDSNSTDCEFANYNIDNKTDEFAKNNFEVNTQTTYCGDATQVEAIDLTNDNIINSKDGYQSNINDNKCYQSNDLRVAEKIRVNDTQVTDCDLTVENNINGIEINKKGKDNEKCFILNNKEGYAKAKNKKYKPQNKLKRKLSQPNDTKMELTNNNMLSQSEVPETYIKDSQATELYTVHGFSQPLSHFSQSQVINTYNIEPKHLGKAKERKVLTKEEYYIQLTPDVALNNTTLKDSENINANVDEINSIANTYTEEQHINLCKSTLCKRNKAKRLEQKKYTINDNSKDTVKRKSINNFDTMDTKQNRPIIKNIIKKDKSNDNSNTENKSILKLNINKENETEIDGLNTKNAIDGTEKGINIESTNNKTIRTNNNKQDTNQEVLNIENTKEVNEKVLNIETSNNENTLNTLDKQINEEEVIPFKVIEEMNRVKMFLARSGKGIREDGFSLDSGYKSDSQIRSSLNFSSQNSQNWLNQSAHCLLDYLLKCPLLTTNMEFTEEISMILRELIDKLHAEENYPPFLNLILEKIEIYLEEISRGNEDEMGTITEQTIHRLLLLNKSINIVKFTLEKLTKILENIHENLTNTDPYYEITNVNETQKTAYIFHILEVILKRYMKQKDDIGSQNTQPSQNLTKKTCISDIWRAKWNSKFKSFKELPSKPLEKEDVTERMAAILNKIIINCMDSYSLVSFAALQSFNVLQS